MFSFVGRGRGGGGGGGCTHFMRSRSPKTIDPRFPTMPARSTEHVGFSPTRQRSRAPSAKRRDEFGKSHDG